MRIEVHDRGPDFDSDRAARVKGSFKVKDGSVFRLDAELAIHDRDWPLGLVVGPSGSGETSLGRAIRRGRGARGRARWLPTENHRTGRWDPVSLEGVRPPH